MTISESKRRFIFHGKYTHTLSLEASIDQLIALNNFTVIKAIIDDRRYAESDIYAKISVPGDTLQTHIVKATDAEWNRKLYL